MAQYDFYQNETGFLTLDLNYRIKDSQSPGSLTYHPVADEYAETAEFDLRGQTHHGGWFLDYKAFSQYIDYQYDESGVPPARYQTKTFGLDFAGQYALAEHQLLSGFTLRQDDFKGTSTGNHTLDNGALFLQDEWKISGQWQLVSGLRWDTGSVFSSPVSPRMSLIHQVSEALTVKLGYGKAFRAPTVNDLYYPEDSWGMIGNPDLLPERSERYEITGEWKQGSHLWSANLFKADVKDGISWEFDGTHFKPINIEKMQVNGITLSWQKQIHKILNTGIRYSWIDKLGWNSITGTYSDDANYFGSSQLTYNLGFKYKQWNGGLDWHYVGKRAAQYGTVMPDYQWLNLNLGYQANANLAYKFTVNNIFDEEYQIHSGYPMPGREIVFSMNTKF
jgi:outer membrane cobalamin receptor